MKKPGFKTASFWATTLLMLGTVVVSTGAAGTNMEPTALGKILALGFSLAGAAGYARHRGLIKKGDPSKPWYKQTEWYLSVAAVTVGVLLASGVFGVDSTVAKAVAAVGSLLALMGYGKAQGLSAGESAPGAMTELK